jgi:hypothetical protein
MLPVAAGLTVIVVVTIAVMHEEVHEGTSEQEQVGQRSKDVGPMLIPEKEYGDPPDQAGAHPDELEGG